MISVCDKKVPSSEIRINTSLVTDRDQTLDDHYIMTLSLSWAMYRELQGLPLLWCFQDHILQWSHTSVLKQETLKQPAGNKTISYHI